MAPMSLRERYDRLLERLRTETSAEYGDRLVSLAVFGSVGRQTQREDSDVDLLVVARDLPNGRFARVDEFLPVETRLADVLRTDGSGQPPIRLAPIFKSPAEVERGSPLFLDMVEDARILYDPDQFFTGYLDRLRARLRELGARRIWRGNAWYWDLKPDFKPGDVISL
jgi:uncharacterized protein